MKNGKKLYILYDGRAILGNTDDAMVLETCNTLDNAIGAASSFGETAIYEYTSDGKYLKEETLVAWTKADSSLGWRIER